MSKSKRIIRRDYLPPDKYLTTEEINRLRQTVRKGAQQARRRGTVRGLVNEMLVELMLESGLRAEEVCHLQLRDLPTHHGKDIILVRHGRGNILRTVNVKKALKPKLQEFIRTCRQGAKPGSPLFVNEGGYRLLNCKVWRDGKLTKHKEYTARLAYHSLYCKIRCLGRQAGIHLTPHMLRHTFAAHLHAVEHDLLFVKDQLGHSRTETTARYAKVFDEARERQTEQLY